MKTLTYVAVLLLAATLAPPARAAEAVRQTLRVVLGPASRGDERCTELAGLISANLRGRSRFLMLETDDKGAAKPTFRLILECSQSTLSFQWLYADQHGYGPVADLREPIDVEIQANLPALAYKATYDVLRQLPWDGELSGTIRPHKHMQHAVSTVGSVNSELVARCLPIVVGRLRPGAARADVIDPQAAGVLTEPDDFSSSAEFYARKHAGQIDAGALVFRFSDPAEVTEKQKAMVEACHAKTRSSEGSLFAQLRERFSTEELSVTSNSQNAGVELLRVNASNGATAPAVLAATFTDRVGIGTYLLGVVDGYKDAYSKPYTGPDALAAPKPLVTVVQTALLAQFHEEATTFGFGIGAVGSKINVPYDLVGAPPGDAPVRPVKVVPAAFATVSLAADEWTTRFDGTLWPGSTDRYASLRFTADYHLFNAWFAGAELRYDSFGPLPGNIPGLGVEGLGFHLGFALIK